MNELKLPGTEEDKKFNEICENLKTLATDLEEYLPPEGEIITEIKHICANLDSIKHRLFPTKEKERT